MKAVNMTSLVLLIIGGLNWGLVGLAGFDLVAFLTGTSFGGMNIVGRVIYLLVGIAALYEAGHLVNVATHHGPRHATA